MRIRLAAALAALVPVASIGCGVTDPTPPTAPPPPAVVEIRLEPAAANLLTGETRQLTATPLDRSGNSGTSRLVTWVTTAPTVATVSQTVTLMRRFYERYGRGADPAGTLAAAQRAMLATPATAHPYYWAGFEVIGGR